MKEKGEEKTRRQRVGDVVERVGKIISGDGEQTPKRPGKQRVTLRFSEGMKKGLDKLIQDMTKRRVDKVAIAVRDMSSEEISQQSLSKIFKPPQAASMTGLVREVAKRIDEVGHGGVIFSPGCLESWGKPLLVVTKVPQRNQKPNPKIIKVGVDLNRSLCARLGRLAKKNGEKLAELLVRCVCVCVFGDVSLKDHCVQMEELPSSEVKNKLEKVKVHLAGSGKKGSGWVEFF